MNNACRVLTASGLGLLLLPSILPGDGPMPKQTVAYREVDGHQVLLDIYRPAGERVRPVLVWIHGGALIMGHRETIHPVVRALAEEQQYALVSIDYRLAPETKLPALISDIETAFTWLGGNGARQFHLDPQRIAVTGGSAGGYLTLLTGYRTRPQPKALVAFFGYGSLTADWYSRPSRHARHNPRPISREEAFAQTDGKIISDARSRKGDGSLLYLHFRQQGTWPREVSGFAAATLAEQIATYEPVRNVTAQYPPTMLIHGTRDTDVPFEESAAMAEQLQRHKIPVSLKPIQGGEHGFGGGDPAQIEEAYRDMRTFLTRHLGD